MADNKKRALFNDRDLKVGIMAPPKFYCTECGRTEAVYVRENRRFECPCGAMWTVSFEKVDYEDFDDD